jgi:hypothetical protein
MQRERPTQECMLMSNLNHVHLNNDLVAPYDFSIVAVIKEAWTSIKGAKGAFLAGIIIAGVATTLVTVVSLFLFPLPVTGKEQTGLDLLLPYLKGLPAIIITLPLWTALAMMGVKRALGLPLSLSFWNILSPSRIGILFTYYSYFLPLAVVGVLRLLIPAIPAFLAYNLATYADNNLTGFSYNLACIFTFLLILATIYLGFSYLFATLLVVEKKLSPWQALEVSRKAVSQHWFKLFFTFMLYMLIYYLSCIPLFIGLVWTLPMRFTLSGVLYSHIFGVTLETSQAQDS